MWKDLFREHILARGLNYFIQDLVKDVHVNNNIIEATVYGTNEYEVEIQKDNEDIKGLSCTCPHSESGNNCKHMAAVLFYLEDKDNIFERQNIEEEVEELVEETDLTIIKGFLIEILKNDTKLYNRFKSKLKRNVSQIDMERFKIQANDIFRSYSGYRGFIDYNNAWNFTSELEEFLDNYVQVMIDNNQLKEAFELTNHIIIKLADQDMDDSDGGISEIANSCLEIWKRILDNCDMDLKSEIFKWFVVHLNEPLIDYMEDYIDQIVFEDFKEEEFMEKKVQYLDEKMDHYKKEQNSWLSNYRLDELAKHRLEIFEANNVAFSTIEEYCKENLEITEVRKYYIDTSIKRKEYDTAIRLLKEGKEKEKDRLGLLINYSVQLKDIYKEISKHQLYEEELWLLVINYTMGNVELFKELKQLYSSKDWLVKREIIFSALASHREVSKLYELEGLYDRLIDLITNSYGLYMLLEYEETLKDIYPEELLDKYENTVNSMATYSTGRAYYKEIVSILRKMMNYPKGEQKVSEIIDDWRLRYKNRPAMMNELNKL